MSKLRLTLACWDYDRTRALADGRVTPEGVELNFLPLQVEETFFRMLRGSEFDAAEMSLSSYCVTLHRPDPAFIAIPVFPSRFFRHSCIFVSARSAVRCAEGSRRQAGRRARVPDDGAGLDPRDPRRRVRRAMRRASATSPAARKSRAASRS